MKAWMLLSSAALMLAILLVTSCNTVPYAATSGEWTTDFEEANIHYQGLLPN